LAEGSEAIKNNHGNNINRVEFGLFIWEVNLKFLNTQFNQWRRLGQSCINAIREFFGNLSKATTPWRDLRIINAQFDHPFAFQKDYINSVGDFSDEFVTETMNLSRRNAEMAFSFFDSCLTWLVSSSVNLARLADEWGK
jgi:hypothetical protein